MISSISKHAEIVDAAIARDEAARYPLVASWQRSRVLYQLNPNTLSPPERVTQKELSEKQEYLGAMLSLSQAKLDQLYLTINGTGSSVVLTDQTGIVIARRGAEEDNQNFYDFGLWLGADWSESSEGTNGIGTCISEERPLTIHKDQHFHSKNTELSCTAAPIFDHNANLMAIIDVSSCRTDLTLNFSRLVSVAVNDTASRIEAEHFSKHFSDAQIILVPVCDTFDHVCPLAKGVALIAVDQNDLVIGATRAAREIYGLTNTNFNNPLPLPELQGRTVDLARDYALSKNRIIQQSLAKSGGNVSLAAQEIGISRATLHRELKKIQQYHD